MQRGSHVMSVRLCRVCLSVCSCSLSPTLLPCHASLLSTSCVSGPAWVAGEPRGVSLAPFLWAAAALPRALSTREQVAGRQGQVSPRGPGRVRYFPAGHGLRQHTPSKFLNKLWWNTHNVKFTIFTIFFPSSPFLSTQISSVGSVHVLAPPPPESFHHVKLKLCPHQTAAPHLQPPAPQVCFLSPQIWPLQGPHTGGVPQPLSFFPQVLYPHRPPHCSRFTVFWGLSNIPLHGYIAVCLSAGPSVTLG